LKAMSLLSEDLGRLHRSLQDAASAESDAASEVERLETELRAAVSRAKAKRSALLGVLEDLKRKPVTVAALEKTLVGVTVNGLRRHEHESVAAKAEDLVRSWKTVVEGGSTWGALAGGAAAGRAAPGSSSWGGHGAGVLDEVCDEDGNVERRRAHPDSHEDQLALREAAEVERMWEEQMGARGRGGSGDDEVRALNAQLPASSLNSTITASPHIVSN